ncbi:MAG TPA: hypothetical protein VGZ47_11585 [Gemmataceae bacterium]|nr:hypothetical protein [Gemmataceae bacterium]
MAAKSSAEFQLSLNDEERTELLRLLDDCVVEIHAEIRRTEAPDYHEKLRNKETLIRALTEKVRRLGK